MKHTHQDMRKITAIAAIAAMVLFSFAYGLAPIYNTLQTQPGYNNTLDLRPFVAKTAPNNT